MSDNKVEGWTNYATWRINLELLSDYDFAEDILESDNKSWRPDVDYLKDLVEHWVFENHTGHMGLMEDYARSFVDQVNYHEILEHILENIDNELKARGFLSK
jgi:broad-specificity NMP kinase